jgi:apolipoprotein N-acyltransferase
LKAALLALAAGGLLPLALAPFGIWPLAYVSPALFFFVLQSAPRRRVLTGWLYGCGLYGVGASWIFVSIHSYGNASVPLAALLVVLFVCGLALFWAACGWLYGLIRPQRIALGAAWFVFVFSFFDWLLCWFLTGFPWLFPGYAAIDTWLAGLVPLGGVLLLNLVFAAGGVALVLLVDAWRRGRLAGAAASVSLVVLLAPWPAGLLLERVHWSLPTSERTVALIQGNVDQAEKWKPENRDAIVERYLRLSEPYWGVDLLIWPEAAITVFEHEAGPLLSRLDARGRASGTALVLGIPAYEILPDRRVVFRNTAIGLGRASGRYVKRRLVPFGEYVPLEGLLRGLIEFFDLPMSRAEPGAWQQPLLDVGDASAQMAICYEIVYPDLVRTPASDVLLTISNDSWFGASVGPLQHLEMARMRALENARWLLRGTNNGVTAIVDPGGRVVDRLPQFESGALTGTFETRTGLTPYGRFGNWPFLALLGVLGAVALGLRKAGK